MGSVLQPLSVQQGVPAQGAAAKASLPSTWSDPTVNISLDFLSPGMQPPKPSQPSLNTLQHGEAATIAVSFLILFCFLTFFFSFNSLGNQAPANMLAQGFSSMNLGPTPVRPAFNTMMHPGMGMGMGMSMAPNQGMMGMNMGMPQGGMPMGMPQGGMAMGMPGTMGMGMSPAMAQQPKHDAFADFGNFGK